MRFQDLKYPIHLYHGDVPKGRPDYDKITGLSLSYDDYKHIKHDIRNRIDLPSCSVESIQSESVMEYINWWEWVDVLNHAHRVLVPGGLLRLSVPDYRADVLKARCQYNASGAVCYDPGGGVDVKWFPTADAVFWLCSQSRFESVILRHGIWADGTVTMEYLDDSFGYVKRTPYHDVRAQNPNRVLSLVVDLAKMQ